MTKENPSIKELSNEDIFRSMEHFGTLKDCIFEALDVLRKDFDKNKSFEKGQLSAKEEEVKFLETVNTTRDIQNRLNYLVGQIHKIKESLK